MDLLALGHFHPPTLLPNTFFSEALGLETDDQWIRERTGITQRHTVLPLDYLRETKNRDVRAAQEAAEYDNAETGRRAGLMALARAGLKPGDIGMVIAGGCSPDSSIPAEASRIAAALDIDAPALDLHAACSSFGAQLHFLAGMRPEALPDHVLVVNPENSTRVVDYSDRSSCVLWGDGTTAAILSPRHPGRWRVTDTLLAGQPAGWDKVQVPRIGHFTQRGAEVQRFAVQRAGETFATLRRRYLERHPAHSASEVTLIGHQANLRMLESVQRRCEVPEERHLHNVSLRGNTGAAGAPGVLSENWDAPDEVLGDAIGIAVVGSGLAWAGVMLERRR